MSNSSHLFLLVITALALLPATNAATIHGEVYTYDLRLVTDSVLTINTTPEQIITLTQGSYEIELPPGTYLLRIQRSTPAGLVFSDEQIITITQPEGTYQIDFLLFPQLPEEEGLIIHLPYEDEQEQQKNSTPTLIAVLIALTAILVIIIVVRRDNKHEQFTLDDDAQTVLSHIKRERRVLQRELRTLLPYSEAKLSLIITDLESQGLVKKVKKGRGNILIYQGRQRSQTTSEQH